MIRNLLVHPSYSPSQPRVSVVYIAPDFGAYAKFFDLLNACSPIKRIGAEWKLSPSGKEFFSRTGLDLLLFDEVMEPLAKLFEHFDSIFPPAFELYREFSFKNHTTQEMEQARRSYQEARKASMATVTFEVEFHPGANQPMGDRLKYAAYRNEFQLYFKKLFPNDAFADPPANFTIESNLPRIELNIGDLRNYAVALDTILVLQKQYGRLETRHSELSAHPQFWVFEPVNTALLPWLCWLLNAVADRQNGLIYIPPTA